MAFTFALDVAEFVCTLLRVHRREDKARVVICKLDGLTSLLWACNEIGICSISI